jgi:hypothetical protein
MGNGGWDARYGRVEHSWRYEAGSSSETGRSANAGERERGNKRLKRGESERISVLVMISITNGLVFPSPLQRSIRQMPNRWFESRVLRYGSLVYSLSIRYSLTVLLTTGSYISVGSGGFLLEKTVAPGDPGKITSSVRQRRPSRVRPPRSPSPPTQFDRGLDALRLWP